MSTPSPTTAATPLITSGPSSSSTPQKILPSRAYSIGVRFVAGKARGEVVGLVGHAVQPSAEPAAGALGEADPQRGVAVEHAAQRDVGEQSLCAPRVRRHACDRQVAPDVAIPGEVRGLVEEGVVHERQVGIVHRLPDRRQRRIVDRHLLGQQHLDRGEPRAIGDRPQLGCRPLGVARVHQRRRLETAGVATAVGVEIAVVGGVQLVLHLDVEHGRRRRERGREDQCDVDPSRVHVVEPALPVLVVDLGDRLDVEVELDRLAQRDRSTGAAGLGLALVGAGVEVAGEGIGSMLR